MKKNFVYGLSALLVASMMMAQMPTQAATKDVKKPPHQRVIKQQKGMTGGAASVTDKKTTETKTTVKTTTKKPMTGGAAGMIDKKPIETKSTVKTTKPMPSKKY